MICFLKPEQPTDALTPGRTTGVVGCRLGVGLTDVSRSCEEDETEARRGLFAVTFSLVHESRVILNERIGAAGLHVSACARRSLAGGPLSADSQAYF